MNEYAKLRPVKTGLNFNNEAFVKWWLKVERKSTPFLVRIKPLEYESLDSYLFRIGQANGYLGLEWTRVLKLPDRVTNNIGLSTIDNEEVFEYISELTGVSKIDIRKMTINYYQNELLSDKYRFINRLTRVGNLIKFCPICLKESLYERIYWRFPLLITCPIHSCLLNYKCSLCNKPIKLTNLFSGVCDCGKLIYHDIRFPKYSPLVTNQKKFYKIFRIKLTNKDQPLNDNDEVTYVKLLNFWLGRVFDIHENPYEGEIYFPEIYDGFSLKHNHLEFMLTMAEYSILNSKNIFHLAYRKKDSYGFYSKLMELFNYFKDSFNDQLLFNELSKDLVIAYKEYFRKKYTVDYYFTNFSYDLGFDYNVPANQAVISGRNCNQNIENRFFKRIGRSRFINTS